MKQYRKSFQQAAVKRNAFTLVELLIVLAIIGLLAAILFPAFKSAQEKGYQANCTTNLQQIYQAVQLYRQDEKYYPGSLGTLLPTDYDLDGGTNGSGTGYFKGGRDTLICKDDDTDAGATVRSSYGDLSATMVPPATSSDISRYLWNYWGYRKTLSGTCTDTDASGCGGTAFRTSADAQTAGDADKTMLLLYDSDPTAVYNARTNPVKYSLSNRYAPTSTIITHCVFHRLPTANGKIAGPFDVYTDTNGMGARDIILRVDGSARLLDISNFQSAGYWQKQNF